jgi:hypothetical protein
VVVDAATGRANLADAPSVRVAEPAAHLGKAVWWRGLSADGLDVAVTVDGQPAEGLLIAESVEALLDAGARPEIIVAATHGLLLAGAREKLARTVTREVLVTDTVAPPAHDWPQLRVVSVAPLIASALRRFLSDGPLSATPK